MAKVYFGRGIIDMTEAQDKELRKNYEKLLERKLSLGSNFLRKLLHGRVKSMGTGTMSPNIAIAALMLKLHLSRLRIRSENGKIIKDNQIIDTVSGRNNSSVRKINDSRQRLWTENTKQMLEDMNASTQNGEQSKISENKIVMEHAIECENE